ncbi:TRAP transporter small permease [Denitrificimonas sp. JX-1]|uniref:TRAP transporter small permease protein n=1 Tax=Denitrificimonas halotolerans TaxID=3098930 RepID=A0ABU5GU21_9GAMM|nr:TRAP transporter small permease [Denitrificimonas sp. JX-1]MDY7219736.1 TRAP transporter small permease [Denitrificimonas sp. JX-1]
MNTLRLIWDRFEEAFIVFLLSAMTLVTFVYVILNNVYSFFYSLADYFAEHSEGVSEFFFTIGDFFLDIVQTMTWSNALTKALFAWLIFVGLAYGVRIGGHIGVDALVKLASRSTQRVIAIFACLFSLGYAGLLSFASFEWINTLLTANIGADDLGQYGIKQWHIAMIVPIGFTLVFIRYLEILVRIIRHQQVDLGLADEAADAMKLSETEAAKE